MIRREVKASGEPTKLSAFRLKPVKSVLINDKWHSLEKV